MPSNTMQTPRTDASVQQLREQIRENVRQQLEAQRAQLEAQRAAREASRDAAQAARDAAQEARDAARAGPAGPAPPAPPAIPHIMINKDGKAVVVGEDGQAVVVDQDAMNALTGMQMFPAGPPIPREAVIISIAFFVMIAVIAIGLPLARAIARRMDRRTAQPAIPPELMAQLQRLEQSVDTIAVEVERISEAQRFSSGLLREMHPILQRTQGAAAALVDRANGGTP